MGSTFLYILVAIGVGTLSIFANPAIKFISLHFLPPSQPLQPYKRTSPQPAYAIITGGSSGIGFGIAKELVKNGFAVFLLGDISEELTAAKEALKSATPGAQVTLVMIDTATATPDLIESMVDILPRSYVSILVNNMGGGPCCPVAL